MAQTPSSVKLHAVRPADIVRLAAWLPEVADKAGDSRWATANALADSAANSNVLTNDEASAFIAFDLAAPEKDAAQIDFLAVAPEQRRVGIGGRVVFGVERRLKSKAKRLYTLVPASIGLALYFWLRLGYRPLVKNESLPVPGGDASVWMVRDL
jgi:ribosomal protein S18 acetylase RimI-like enzyme